VNALLKITLWLAATAAVPAVQAETAKTAPAKPVPARSVFIMPSSPREGRDPFFPESTRPFEELQQQTNSPVKALAVKGLSWEHGRAMVIINNHTFAIGDEGDVLTTGGRVHLRLAEIHKDAVVIEVNGSRRELKITTK
jgi:hypothetical protein